MIVLAITIVIIYFIYIIGCDSEDERDNRRLLNVYFERVQLMEQQHIEDVTALKAVEAERDKYQKALEAIASTKYDMNKLVCIAIEALKGKSNESE